MIWIAVCQPGGILRSNSDWDCWVTVMDKMEIQKSRNYESRGAKLKQSSKKPVRAISPVAAKFGALPERAGKGKATVLIISATPRDQGHLDVDVEVNQIKDAWRKSQLRERVEIVYEPAVLVSQLQSHLQEHEPDILHFAGHGESHGILVEKADGNKQVISNEALVKTLKLYRQTLRCVVLNACYSEGLATLLASELGVAVGMITAVGDRSAIKFARGFYRAICNGRDVRFAFESGCVEVDLETLPGANYPQLRHAVDPATVIFVQPEKENAMSGEQGAGREQSGGINFDGESRTEIGRDAIGRDRIHNETHNSGDNISIGSMSGTNTGIAIGRNSRSEVTVNNYGNQDKPDLSRQFQPLCDHIAQEAPDDERDFLNKVMNEMRGEVERGGDADDGTISGAMADIADVLPSAKGLMIALFADPRIKSSAGRSTLRTLERWQRRRR